MCKSPTQASEAEAEAGVNEDAEEEEENFLTKSIFMLPKNTNELKDHEKYVQQLKQLAQVTGGTSQESTDDSVPRFSELR